MNHNRKTLCAHDARSVVMERSHRESSHRERILIQSILPLGALEKDSGVVESDA